jgi:hypothetical protein
MIRVQYVMLATAWCSSNTGCELLRDEAVEAIGREDYYQMVACLGQ